MVVHCAATWSRHLSSANATHLLCSKLFEIINSLSFLFLTGFRCCSPVRSNRRLTVCQFPRFAWSLLFDSTNYRPRQEPLLAAELSPHPASPPPTPAFVRIQPWRCGSPANKYGYKGVDTSCVSGREIFSYSARKANTMY